MTNSAEPSTVLADPQMTVESLLRPQANFQSIYAGNGIESPLYWFPDGMPLDERAGQPGVDPTLVRGLQVTPGSTLQLWLPNLLWENSLSDPTSFLGYQWFVVWRLRNILDFRLKGQPYHLSRVTGVTDTVPTPDEARALIPAAYDTLVFNQQPAFSSTTPDAPRAVGSIRAQELISNADKLRGPLLDVGGTEGAVQQGVLDPTVDATAKRPSWLRYELKVPAADEMLLGCRRTEGPANWTFTGGSAADAALLAFLSAGDNNGVMAFRAVDGTSGQASTDIGIPTS